MLVCMDPDRRVLRGDLLVRDGRITAVGPAVSDGIARDPAVAERIDASGCYVLPGFVHGHLHTCQTLFRGHAEQSDLLAWLRESIWPMEAAHTEASIAASARLAACELIAGGTTCINDMGSVHHTEVTASVLEESGLRAIVGKALMDRGDGVPARLIEDQGRALHSGLALAKRFHGSGDGRLSVSLAPRFILSCSEALWRDVRDAARELGLLVHTHLAESRSEGVEVERAVGLTAARYFAEHGLLGERFVGAHGVWLEPDELAAIRSAHAALVHCPVANMKLGSGLARVRAWRDSGIRCGIGSDGAACNNRLDMFAEMSLAAGISRVVDSGGPLSAREIVELATCEGARAIGLGATIGSLEAGKHADITVLDASAPELAPESDDPYVTIVHAMRAAHVRLTMVAGAVLYRNGQWSGLDPERVASEARKEAAALLRRTERP
jgi:5-methylthioadenosine/S-adenosylhomocysteine deaminase